MNRKNKKGSAARSAGDLGQAGPVQSVSGGSKEEKVPTRIWDPLVRLSHWALVLLVSFSWLTGKFGALAWHRLSGYAILGLVLFRIYWGFAGSSTARFAHFLRGPRAVWEHSKTLLQRHSAEARGHTPLGGWNVVILLLLLLLQTSLGLFAVDIDGLESGPLSDLVSFETGREFAAWHGRVVDLLLAFVALHIAAILYYRLYKRENLTAAMLSGDKYLPVGARTSEEKRIFWRAVVGLLAATVVVVVVVTRLQR